MLVVPAFGTGALLLLATALLLATLPASRLRRLALLPALAGLAFAAFPQRQDLYVDRQGTGAALRGADGHLTLLGKPSRFVLEQWLKADGDDRRAADLLATSPPSRCDRLGCTALLPDGRAIALVKDSRAFPEDCARASIVITALTAPSNCAAPLVLDRRRLSDRGAAR